MNKRLHIYIIFLLAMIIIIASCFKKDRDIEQPVQEGVPVAINISFDVSQMETKIVTRQASSAADENRVQSLYVFVFNSDGTKSAGQYFTYGQLQDKQEVPAAAKTTGRVTLKATSGANKTVFAIANVSTTADLFNLTTGILDTVTTMSGLRSITATMADDKASIFRLQGAFLMSGVVGNQTINTDGTSSVAIPLYRFVSKIKFIVSTGPGITFTLTKWKVVNASKKAYIIESSTDATGTAATDYFSTEEYNFENPGNQFEFYIPENRKTPKQRITAPAGTDAASINARYKKRAARIKSAPDVSGNVTNGAFEYANDNTTCVIFKGTYTKTEANGNLIEGVATYTVPLGYTAATEPENDYAIDRRYYYNYTATINGVNEIIVEANRTGGEPNPGVEGEVVYSKAGASIDAHYGVQLLTVNQNDIIPASLDFYANTPYDSLNAPASVSNPGKRDAGWVKFRLNDVGSTALQAYPGDGNSALLTGQQLVDLLKSEKNNPAFFDASGKRNFTVYVDEYYYTTNPTTGAATNYMSFVNKPPRKFILKIGGKTSADGKSLLIDALYIISQRSIETIYDPVAAAAGIVGYGMESFNETGILQYQDAVGNLSSSNSTLADGRANSIQYWGITLGSTAWSTYVSSGNTMQSSYNNVRYACMQRNRDNNGNNVIDADEVRWYLPAINQLVGTWIGTWGFSPEVRMFTASSVPSSVSDIHMASSSLYPGQSRTYQLWAEEGASTGPINQIPGTYNYRCMRNLGGAINDAPGAYSVFTAATASSPAVISLSSRMNQYSLRSSGEFIATGNIPIHTHRTIQNRPYKAFYIANSTFGTGYNWANLQTAITNGSVCAGYTENGISGWRIPNQRELLLMSIHLPPTDPGWTQSNYWAGTNFEFDPTRGFGMEKAGSIWQSRLYGANTTSTLYVRCVKDKP